MKLINRILGALAVAGVMLVGGLSAQAQGVPSGSYTETCSNIQMDGRTLQANCKRFDGSMNKTELPFANSCVGTISNVNGVLACTGPTGSYAQTCHDAQVEDGVLSATCQRRDGSWTRSHVRFQGFQHPVTNCDGQLVNRKSC